jgi:hypothetical protein
MKPLLAALVLSTMLGVSTIALSGEIVDNATKAEQFLSEKKFEDAVKALEEAQGKLWQKAPLMFRRALFTAGEPTGYGLYDLRETNVFKRSEAVIIYAEPLGYSYGRDGSLYIIDLGLDFIIRSPDGKELVKREGFGSLTLRSRFPNKEFFAKVTYDFSGLEPSDYEVTTIAHDKASGKSAEFTLPFKLVD